MTLSADLLRGYTEAIILQRLCDENSYGYLINKRISELTDGAFELKEATLYTAFRRLEQGGMITSYWGDENSGARRRYYAITQTGRDRLTQERDTWAQTRQLIDRLLSGQSTVM